MLRRGIPGWIAIALALAGCSGAASAPSTAPTTTAITALPDGSAGRIEVRLIDARPRLALVARDGDPTPAVVVMVATDLGSAPTTALAAVVEARLRAAGFDVDARVDRSAFRVRLLLADPSRAGALVAALAAAFARPIAPGSPELTLAAQRVAALKRNPLDAVELVPIAGCTGALGVAPGEALPDLGSPAGAALLEGWRASALEVGRTAIAAVGPAAFGDAVAAALVQSNGWPAGPPPEDPWPAADSVGLYASAALDRRSARLTIAARTASPQAATAAAERLGAPDSPLVSRLRALPQPWRIVEVVGAARPRGGCVSVVVETAQLAPGAPLEVPAGLAGALVRAEIGVELALGGTTSSGRQILSAGDPREAAARAAWWSLSGAAPGKQESWAIALAAPAVAGTQARVGAPLPPPEVSLARFQTELARAAGAAGPAAERRLAVERGQGELWVLLASPCGVAEEGDGDAGFGALAALAATPARRGEGATVEPWITADGIGVIAHGAPRDERETPIELGRRIADAAARALNGVITPEAAATARATALDVLGRSEGRDAAAFAVLAAGLTPEHPSWLDPFGLWARVSSSAIEGIRLRQRALLDGPLRVAVLANADLAQATAAADAVDRWLTPNLGPRTCRPGAALPPRPGRYEARLPSSAPIAQALLGAKIPAPGEPGHDLARLTALALGGDGGLLAAPLRQAAATASVRLAGGSRAPALVIDMRAPADGLVAAVAEIKLLLAHLPETAAEADLTRALTLAEKLDREGRAEPRRRLADLFTAPPTTPPAPPPPTARPALAAWRAFIADRLKDAALVLVEARQE